MKALKDPLLEKYGMCYSPQLTDEFESLIETAKEKIKPFAHKEISRFTYYFEVRGEEINDFDCCDDEKCIKHTKKAIRHQYGKGTHVEEHYSDNNGDHEDIEICTQCGKPLNEWLTWCNFELEYLEGEKPWSAQFLKDEGFVINCILQSMPTMDCDILGYAKHQGGEILEEALKSREKFFQRIVSLAQLVNLSF